ncbi:MAG: DUF2442 domain-containing protein [Candidatus Omnitrophica bacterium]|nr:DUF2442 domain-containing protein [Candidatus Omnitrophota bacterium]MBU1367208.1 DUF2442 domain-containing protein [Candidatus Omnitrophota bacterium]MBU1524033.1 DUF2442 domain-containing protein [Candidatus Omnitrophota bacterium]MBU1809544.1 DUF2442 domain-containing protein [Candidatus Omnitrophota bacterium]MBU2436584.1 DUF2442 domain-containing protein [Candidatus Omnitrophota bacterium]
MIYVKEAKYKEDYKIWCRFSNGKNGIVDLKGKLWGPVFEPLQDKEKFKNFKLSDILHTIAWENGADFAPEFLCEHLQK